jgi:hypothetical protein
LPLPGVLEDSIIKDGSYNIDQGVGVRAVSGEKTGFAYAWQTGPDDSGHLPTVIVHLPGSDSSLCYSFVAA